MEIVFYIWLIMCAVYVVFDFKRFLEKWWSWIKLIGTEIWRGIVYVWDVIKSWTGKK